jgi:hypothetical protein
MVYALELGPMTGYNRKEQHDAAELLTAFFNRLDSEGTVSGPHDAYVL